MFQICGRGGRGHVQMGCFLCQWSSCVCDKGTGLPVFIEVLICFFFYWGWGEGLQTQQNKWTGWQKNNLVFLKHVKLGIAMPPCGHMMQVNKDKTCYFNVIFYFEIILLIKSLSTIVPEHLITGRCVTWSWPCAEGSLKVHVTVTGGHGVKRTSSRWGSNTRDPLTILSTSDY